MTSANGPDPKFTTLQNLCLAAEPTICGLYWRLADAEAALVSSAADVCPVLESGHALLFDTYGNCFYEKYWRDLTVVEHISFEIVTSGDCMISLFRRCDDRTETIRTLTASGKKHRTIIHVPSAGANGGVLYAEVKACSEQVNIHGGRWATMDPRKTDVSLAIAICSFGRDDMVADTLARIASFVEASDVIGRIFVVHQGQSTFERHPAIVAMKMAGAYAQKLQIIQQDNFGGSGGFARGIIEALCTEATDILLMDDDVRVEPFVFVRLQVLLAYLKRPMTIGGQMLDLHDPTILWASHEQVDYANLSLVNPFKKIDLTKVDVASLFQNRHASAYNAWWFCSLPSIALESFGLPLPMFIQHDDVEHGVRMTRSGWEVVTMPGLFVWHQVHEPKSKPWLTYYERRNFLINAALHGRVSSLRVCVLSAAQAWAGLTLHRYEYCWAICKAAEDYLCGPSVVFSDSRARHREIVAEAARYTLQAVKFYRARKETMLVRSKNRDMMKRTIDLLRWLVTPASQPKLARQLAWRIVKMVFQLIVFGPQAASDYRVLANRYSDISFWTRYLGLGSMLGPRT